MTQSIDTNAFAEDLLTARRTHSPIDADRVAAAAGATLADAYAIQSSVAAAIGPVGAFKTGRGLNDGDPQIFAPIPASHVRQSPGRFEAGELRRVAVELEIAFRIEQPLPRPGDAGFDDALRAAVSAVAAIEVVDTRLPDPDTAPPLVKLADSQSSCGLVLGEPIKDWQDLELESPSVVFALNGEQLGPTQGKVPGGSAWDMLRGFVQAVGNHCNGIQPGQYVTTGALTGLHWINKGSIVLGAIPGMGEVSVEIGS